MDVDKLKGKHFKLQFHCGPEGFDAANDNVDVEVIFDDGSRYGATFFTIANILSLMSQYKTTGECMHGDYFWASDMIIVQDLSRESIAKVVNDLISSRELSVAFSPLEMARVIEN